MKKYKCIVEKDKQVSVGNFTILLKKDEIYDESFKAIQMYPKLFVEANTIDIIKDVVSDTLNDINSVEHSTESVNHSLIKTSKKVEKVEREEKPFSTKVIEDSVNNVSFRDNKPTENTKNTENTENKVEDKVENKKTFGQIVGKYFKIFLLIISITLVAGLSGYLRAHGINEIFNIPMDYSYIIVGTFIVSEFAIANIMLRTVKSKLNKIVSVIILGIIQLVLIGLSFSFEFSAVSNSIMYKKNETVQVDKQEKLHSQIILDLEKQMDSIQKQIDITPDSYITKRSKLTTEYNKLASEKTKQLEELKNTLSSDEVKSLNVKRTGMENVAKLVHIDEELFIKYLLMFFTGILNILYVAFMYNLVSIWKE